jgi:cold shock CspA family protein
MKKGNITQWNDEKGFGFIIANDGSEKVFFHISSVKASTRRPLVDDNVIYDSSLDSKGRLQAKAVVIEGMVAQSATSRKSQPIQVKPPRKSALDYLLILILLGCTGKTGWSIYQARVIDDAIAPYVILAIVAWFALNRQKKPKEKQFSCARCKAMVDFDSRTIQAWNNGFQKLYCGTCHQRWLHENPIQTRNYSMGRDGGCLGVLCLLITVPVMAWVALFHWMT